MLTEPLKTILDLDMSKVEAKEIINIVSTLLKEEVNYSTQAFGRCIESSSKRPDEDLAVFNLYRHIIEMIDGVEVLLSNCCSTPTIPLLRSSFEASLSMEYILESDYSRSSLAWLYDYYKKQLSFYETLDIETPGGKNFQTAIENDKYLKNVKVFEYETESRKAVSNIMRLFKKSHFQEIEKEKERFMNELKMNNKKKRNPKWFELYNGPINLKELAKYLGRSGQYNFFYKLWSRFIHAQDFSRFFDRTEKSFPTIKKLRSFDEIKEFAGHASTLILGATRLVLKRFRPEESIGGWYIKEVRDLIHLL